MAKRKPDSEYRSGGSRASAAARRSLIGSLLIMLVCTSLFVGSTFAWYTAAIQAQVATIQVGSLSARLVDGEGDTEFSGGGAALSWRLKNPDGSSAAGPFWAPGITGTLEPFRIENTGTLELAYRLIVSGMEENLDLLDSLQFYLSTGEGGGRPIDLYTFALTGTIGADDPLTEGEETHASPVFTLRCEMDPGADLSVMGKKLSNIAVTAYTKQKSAEELSFENLIPVTDAEELRAACSETGGTSAPRTLVLNADIELDEMLTVSSDRPWVVLDLNGHRLTIKAGAGGSGSGQTCPAGIRITSGTVLAITDSGSEGKILLKGASYPDGPVEALFDNRGRLILSGGIYASEVICSTEGGPAPDAPDFVKEDQTAGIHEGVFDWDVSDMVGFASEIALGEGTRIVRYK